MLTVLEPLALAGRLEELWSPRVIARLDAHAVKVAALQGRFGWHVHANEDELFWVLRGRLQLELPEAVLQLEPGQMAVVPRGLPHCPVAEPGCLVLLVESLQTLHAGELPHPLARSLDEQLRPL